MHGFVSALSGWIGKQIPAVSRRWQQLTITRQENRITHVVHKKQGEPIPFTFYTPNALSKLRADTFSTKEPETLRWIDEQAKQGDVLVDIGANVGLYSIYHAKTKGGITYAFEPSVFNLKLLVKNINANGCQDKIRIVSNPLTEANMFASFNLQSTEESGALSSFGVDYGHDGKKLNTQVSYQTLGFSLDYLVETNLVTSVPALVKIDVDGIEHLILRGAKKVLADPACRSVLIEVNDQFTEMASEVDLIMKTAGFALVEKIAAEDDIRSGNFTYNQIWLKQNA